MLATIIYEANKRTKLSQILRANLNKYDIGRVMSKLKKFSLSICPLMYEKTDAFEYDWTLNSTGKRTVR